MDVQYIIRDSRKTKFGSAIRTITACMPADNLKKIGKLTTMTIIWNNNEFFNSNNEINHNNIKIAVKVNK